MKNTANLDINISNTFYSEIVGNIYDAVLSGDWAKPMLQITEATVSNKAFFFLQDLERTDDPVWLEWHANFDHGPEALLKYHENPFDDPFYPVNKSITEGESIDINAHIPTVNYQNTEYYNEVFKPLKVFYALSGCLIRNGKHESAWAINRDINDPPYNQQDMNLITLLTNHLSRALQAHISLQLHKNYADLGLRIMQQTTKGLLVCDSDGGIIYKNEFVNSIAFEHQAFGLEDNKLRLVNSLDQARLAKYMKQCSQYAFSDISLQEGMLYEYNERCFFINVTPLRHSDVGLRAGTSSVLVTITPEESINWDIVSRSFGLTAKEEALLMAIHRKNTLNDLAANWAVSYATLRTQLQSIFKKADVHSQSELMVKLALFKV